MRRLGDRVDGRPAQCADRHHRREPLVAGHIAQRLPGAALETLGEEFAHRIGRLCHAEFGCRDPWPHAEHEDDNHRRQHQQAKPREADEPLAIQLDPRAGDGDHQQAGQKDERTDRLQRFCAADQRRERERREDRPEREDKDEPAAAHRPRAILDHRRALAPVARPAAGKTDQHHQADMREDQQADETQRGGRRRRLPKCRDLRPGKIGALHKPTDIGRNDEQQQRHCQPRLDIAQRRAGARVNQRVDHDQRQQDQSAGAGQQQQAEIERQQQPDATSPFAGRAPVMQQRKRPKRQRQNRRPEIDRLQRQGRDADHQQHGEHRVAYADDSTAEFE